MSPLITVASEAPISETTVADCGILAGFSRLPRPLSRVGAELMSHVLSYAAVLPAAVQSSAEWSFSSGFPSPEVGASGSGGCGSFACAAPRRFFVACLLSNSGARRRWRGGHTRARIPRSHAVAVSGDTHIICQQRCLVVGSRIKSAFNAAFFNPAV